MGEVWRAEHRMLARDAAIKLVRGGADASGREMMARFEREAKATAGLRSPHTVQLYDFGRSDDGAFYYVMELLDGFTLDEVVRRFGPLPAGRVVHVLRQVCHSLAEAHAAGLVHRDIKPGNIFLCRYGGDPDFVKVLDFGLVKTLAASGADLTQTRLPRGHARLHAAGDGARARRGRPHGSLRARRRRVHAPHGPARLRAVDRSRDDPRPRLDAAGSALAPRRDADSSRSSSGSSWTASRRSPDERPESARALDARLAELVLPEPWTREQAERWWNRNAAVMIPVVPPDRDSASDPDGTRVTPPAAAAG